MEGQTLDLDGVIERLLEGRKNRGKKIQLAESEIRLLCISAKDVFLGQPNFLELEAPINICGISFYSDAPSSISIFYFYFFFVAGKN